MGDNLLDVYNLYRYGNMKYADSNSNALNGFYTDNTSTVDDYFDNQWLGTTTTASSWNYNIYQENKIYEIFSYLSEEDIIAIINRIRERGCPEEFIKHFINGLLERRFFSEKFLIDLYDYLDLDLVKRIYNSQIKSQEFSELALLIASK